MRKKVESFRASIHVCGLTRWWNYLKFSHFLPCQTRRKIHSQLLIEIESTLKTFRALFDFFSFTLLHFLHFCGCFVGSINFKNHPTTEEASAKDFLHVTFLLTDWKLFSWAEQFFLFPMRKSRESLASFPVHA